MTAAKSSTVVTLEYGPCPDTERFHTRVPDAYLDRAEDAAKRLARGEYQEQCPTCRFWRVWRTRTGRKARASRGVAR